MAAAAGAGVLLCPNYSAPAAHPEAEVGGGVRSNRLRCGLSVAAGVEGRLGAVAAVAGLRPGAVEAEGLLPLLLILILPPTQLRRTWLDLSRVLVAPPTVWCTAWDGVW